MSMKTIPLTLDDCAQKFGTVTTPDGEVWVRMSPRDQIPGASDLEPRLHLIPVVAETTE